MAADARGSGSSEGVYNLLDRVERQDYHELVEWVARQGWCDGNVGGIGQSYYARSQWFMGIVNPPSLKCIAPYNGAVDPYRGTVYHGGIYRDFMAWWYNPVRVNNLHRAANDPAGKAMPLDLAWEFQRRQTYDDWWRERSPYERLDEIEAMPFANVFRKGHRIRLEIVNGDSMLTDSIFTHRYLWYKIGTDSFHHDAGHPSRLWLPVVPGAATTDAREPGTP